MNIRLNTALSFILLCAAIYSGCTKGDEYLPGLSGNMVGYLYTFDEFGNLLEDHSHVKITAIGLDRSYAAFSDHDGRFELEGLPTGTYELHFEKEGFGLLKQYGVQHPGGKPTILLYQPGYEYAYFLYEMPSTTITNLYIAGDSLFADFSFTEDVSPPSMQLMVCFSRTENFNRQAAEYKASVCLWNYEGQFGNSLMLWRAPFNPGESVYFKAWVYTDLGAIQPFENWRTIHGVDCYYDPESNETIYPNLGNESAQYSFTFPE